MKKYLPLLLILIVGCTSTSRENEDQLRIFLKEWSEALISKDESVRRFYDARFVFPKAVFEEADGLQYNFDIEHIEISSPGDNGDTNVTVPFTITGPGETGAEDGSIVLTIMKTERGFLIREMTQELAVKIKQHSLRLQVSNEPSEITLKYDTILSGIRAFVKALSQHYDSVVYFTEVEGQTLFYVINGNWEYPYEHQKQRDAGNYKMGVVTAENKVIIPVAYTKIYNPNGSFEGMIEVENDGLRGLFHIGGQAFIPAEFEGIYPTSIPGAFAQVKKGESYGWVDNNGRVSFDPSSHTNKKLFQSPIENNSVLEWKFTYPGPIKVLISAHDNLAESMGLIIYPSFIKDLGIAGIANDGVMIEISQLQMGMTDTLIKFEKVESISDRLFGLIAFFMEAGADARSFHSEQNDLLVVDKSLNKVGHLEKLTVDYAGQDPCGDSHPQYKVLEPGLYESEDGHGSYNYYKVAAEGNVEQLTTVRQFNFTKFAKIDESYFNRCYYKNLPYEERKDDGPNLVIFSGISTEDLDLMRNEIFAEYGFIFKSPKWKKHFESKPWYKPQHDNVDQSLTEIDKHNIKFILEYQRLHKGQDAKRDSIRFMWAG